MRFFDASALHAKDIERLAELVKAGADEAAIQAASHVVMRQLDEANRIAHKQTNDYQLHDVGNLRISYDRQANAYYIYLQPDQTFKYKTTRPEHLEAAGFYMVNYDVDDQDCVYGIELLAYSRR